VCVYIYIYIFVYFTKGSFVIGGTLIIFDSLGGNIVTIESLGRTFSIWW
jgi:hypothetical protein